MGLYEELWLSEKELDRSIPGDSKITVSVKDYNSMCSRKTMEEMWCDIMVKVLAKVAIKELEQRSSARETFIEIGIEVDKVIEDLMKLKEKLKWPKY
jgi:hypothetical protein